MLQTTIPKTIIESRTRRKEGVGRINYEVSDNSNKSLCGLVKIKKNTPSGRKFLTLKAKLAFI